MGGKKRFWRVPLLIEFQDIRCLHPDIKPSLSNLQNLFGRSPIRRNRPSVFRV